MNNPTNEIVTSLEGRRSFYSKVGSVCLTIAGFAGAGEFIVHTLPEAVAIGGVAIIGLVGSSYTNRQLINIDHELHHTKN